MNIMGRHNRIVDGAARASVAGGRTVYVAAPWEDVRKARDAEYRMAEAGLSVTSLVWTNAALDSFDEGGSVGPNTPPEPEQARAILDGNHAAIRDSRAIVVLARKGAGRDMYGEVQYALHHGKLVVWVGDCLTLMSFSPGVVRVVDVDSALAWLVELFDRVRVA